MSWFLVDDKLHASLKRLKASTAAMGLWVCAGSWSRDNKTGGYIPREALRALAPDLSDEQRIALAGELVEAKIDGIHEHGYWLPLANGWQFNDWEKVYDEDEDDAEKQRRLSEIRAQAGRKGAESRWHKSASQTEGKNGFATFANGNPDPRAGGSGSGSDPVSFRLESPSGSGSDPADPSEPKDLTGIARDGGKPEAPAPEKSPFRSDDERAVFGHWATALWRKVHRSGEARATQRRLSPIRARLRDRFSVEDLCRAIDVVSRSNFHLGQNDTGKAYIEPGTIFRNREKVEEWLSNRRGGPARAGGTGQPNTGAVNSERYMR